MLGPKLAKLRFGADYWSEEIAYTGGDEDEATRYVAAKWYSGDGSNMDSTRPQSGYPSIQDYTFQVLDKFRQHRA